MPELDRSKLVFKLLTLASTLSSVADGTYTNATPATITDQFGVDTDLYYYGGYATYNFWTPKGFCTNPSLIEFIDNTTDSANLTVHSYYECKSTEAYHPVGFEVNETFKFGNFYFREKRTNLATSAYTYVVQYRMCADKRSECNRSESLCDNELEKFCIVSKDGRKPCSKITDATWCQAKQEKKKVCIADTTNLCLALQSGNYERAFFLWHDAEPCPEVTESPLKYNGEPILLRDHFAIYPTNRNITIDCKYNTSFFMKNFELFVRTLSSTDAPGTLGDRVFNRKVLGCEGETNVTLGDKVFEEAGQKYSLQIVGGAVFEFVNVITVFGKELTIKAKKDLAGIIELNCDQSGSAGPLPDYPETDIWWTEKKTGDKPILNNTFLTTDNKEGEYRCHMITTHRTCSPHRLFTYYASSEPYVLVPETPGPPEETDGGATLRPPGGLTWIWIPVLCFVWVEDAL